MSKSAPLPTRTLPAMLETFGQQASTELHQFLTRQATLIPPQLSHAQTMIRIIEEFCLRGGKRLRPYVTSCGYSLFGGQDQSLIVTASIIPELIHAFLLIHDDIMDQDTQRRGGPTIHALYQKETGSAHVGASLGILAGDLAYTLALQAVAELATTANIKSKIIEYITAAVSQTIYGQELDIRAEQGGESISAEQIAQYKTAYYTFVLPLSIGAALAGAPDAAIRQLADYGIPCGIAFQLADDMIDGSAASSTRRQALAYSHQAKQALASIPDSPHTAVSKEALTDIADFVINRDM